MPPGSFYVVERSMAYCVGPCKKPATHEVRNWQNAVIGHFCKVHADKRAKELNEERK